MLPSFSLKSAKTVIVDVKLAAVRWGRGYISDLWEESRLKEHSADISDRHNKKGRAMCFYNE